MNIRLMRVRVEIIGYQGYSETVPEGLKVKQKGEKVPEGLKIKQNKH